MDKMNIKADFSEDDLLLCILRFQKNFHQDLQLSGVSLLAKNFLVNKLVQRM